MKDNTEEIVCQYVYYKKQIAAAGFYLDENEINSSSRYTIFDHDKRLCIACCGTFDEVKIVYHALTRYRQLISDGSISISAA